MAGSRRSPLLKDQWGTASDTRDQGDRGGHKPRGSRRDRGRERYRDRERRRRPKPSGPNPPLRSPPPARSHFQPDHEGPRQHSEFSPDTFSRGSPGPSHPEKPKPPQNLDFHHSSQPVQHRDPEGTRSLEVERATERVHRRDDFPSSPLPPKRKRTRSPSPGVPQHPQHRRQDHRPQHFEQGDDFDRNFPQKKRGRFSGRGRSRRRSPRRGRDRRKNEGDRSNSSLQRRSRSPVRGGKPYTNPRRGFHSPHPGDEIAEGSRHRSTSRHSVLTANSRLSIASHRNSRVDTTMHSTRPIQSMADDPFRSPSPSRLIPNFDAANASVSVEGDSNGWTGQPPYPGQHGSRNSSPTYNGPPGHSRPSYSGPSYRGGHSGHRGNYQNHGHDRRFSGSGPQNYSGGSSPRSRGHFNNLQWTGSGSRGRGGPRSPHTTHGRSSQSPPPPAADSHMHTNDEGGNQFIPANTDLQGEGDHVFKPGSENGDHQQTIQPTQDPNTSSTPNKGGKFSFAFKAKTAPAPAPKPVPDLAQRMQAREPPPRVAEPPRNRMATGPPPRFKPDTRFDRRDRDRDRDRPRDRDRDRGRNDRRDFREPRGFREQPRDGRDNRRDDRRFDPRRDRRRGDRRQDSHPERRPREHSPGLKKQPKILTRPKPRPVIPEEFVKSDSVYYRKPGNESVIGAGTYGKVFKAIHVYTQRQVALKKIRMEGEKDGFPVTAVREIKLLQHLRNHNVVSLLEVMVERNECFMVFEYLSHDLTGLINHPTFTLTAAHKKDLAKQMFEGLNYLHHRGVLHRDIKAANILISNRGLLKFADFGLARFFSKSRQLDYTNRVITIWYRPPELLLGETRYGPAVDVWSAACVYVEMFTKKAVFPGEGGEISQLDKLYNSLGTPTRTEWPDLVEMPWFELMRPTERRKRIFEDVYREILTPAALDLVSQIFQYDPAKRPTTEEVLAHPYFVSEEPGPQQATELENIEGDWHEFESKALRKEKDKEARRAEYQKDKEKRKAGSSAPQSDRETKRAKQDSEENPQLPALSAEQ